MADLARADLKTAARARLKGKVGFILLSCIIYGVVAAVVPGLGTLIVGGPLTVGLMGVILMIARGREPSYNDLFGGFKSFMGGFVAYLLVAVFTILWSLLLIVPGVIASIRYSQTFYILNDNPGMEGAAAIERSKEMMRGHKGEYFVLCLSFFWWHLLGLLTLGIAYLWVGPYIALTFANYYEYLKAHQAG